MDGACAHVAREAGGEAAVAMQLGTAEICDLEEEDGSRGRSRGSWSVRQQRCDRRRNSGERTAAAGSCGCGRGLEMAMAALQREAAALGQRWQREIAAVEAGSIVLAAMLAAAEGKKGDDSAKMAATGKKQRWDRWQQRAVHCNGRAAAAAAGAMAALQRCETADLKKTARWQCRATLCRQRVDRCYGLLKAALIAAVDQRGMCVG
ncbi:hypothetical protein GW17_00011636 [Ensete ventricosum]|nr:hypothetical protein GW17_00011636 [Ensete ventricosum]